METKNEGFSEKLYFLERFYIKNRKKLIILGGSFILGGIFYFVKGIVEDCLLKFLKISKKEWEELSKEKEVKFHKEMDKCMKKEGLKRQK